MCQSAIDFLQIADRLENMTVGQMRAALDAEEENTLLSATSVFRDVSRDELGERVGQAAIDTANSLRHIARLAANNQPIRNLKVAQIISDLAFGYEKVAKLFHPNGVPGNEVDAPASLPDAIDKCIQLAVTHSFYRFAEALTQLNKGIGGDAESLEGSCARLEAMGAKFKTVRI